MLWLAMNLNFRNTSHSVPVGKKLVTEPLATIPNSNAMRTYVLMSVKANLKPCQKDCPSLLTQSSIPISSWSLQVASWRCSSESHLVVRGKLGRMKKARKATPMVMAPSRMTSDGQYDVEKEPILRDTYKANAMPRVQDVPAYHPGYLQR